MKQRPIPASHPEAWPHPGALLREYVLPALNLSVSQASIELRMTRQSLHRIMAGQAAITAETSLRLERFCGVSSRRNVIAAGAVLRRFVAILAPPAV